MSTDTNKPVGPHSNMTDKPADAAKPAGATTAPVTAKPTGDAGKPATGAPADTKPVTPAAPQPATATVTGDRGAPQPAKPEGKPVEPAKPAPVLTGKAAKKAAKAAARQAAGNAQAAKPEGKPTTAPVTPQGDDLSNVLGFDLRKWPTTKTMSGAVPPLNVAVLSDGTFADADKPGEWAGRLHNGKPVTVTRTVTMLDCLHAAGALGVTTRGATNRMLALACILRPDSIAYSRKAWGIVCAFINGGTGETVDNFTIHSEAPAIRKRLYVAVPGVGQGGGKSYGVELTMTGYKLISTAFAGLHRPVPWPQPAK